MTLPASGRVVVIRHPLEGAQAPLHPREVIEAARVHRFKDKAEAAHARGGLLGPRRKRGDARARGPAQTDVGSNAMRRSE